jgi:glycosyltransferase involved in cell wall biosynthesis
LPKKWQGKAYFFPVNGIHFHDFENFSNKEHLENNFLIITAGRLVKIKGFDLAIRAFKIFSEKVTEAKFIIAGDGPELYNLKKIVIDSELENEVVFEGWLPREKLLQKMLLCSIFIFPSLRDGGGNVVVEAMAAGKPIVCFNLAGPGLHVDESCGIKIKPENPEQAVKDIASALERLYFDRELLEKLGKGARKKAEKEYDWDKLGDKLNEIYKKFL